MKISAIAKNGNNINPLHGKRQELQYEPLKALKGQGSFMTLKPWLLKDISLELPE